MKSDNKNVQVYLAISLNSTILLTSSVICSNAKKS